MQKIEQLTAAGFVKAVKHGTVLVNFAMHGCACCEKLSSVIDHMAVVEHFPVSGRIARIYIDNAPLIAAKYEVEDIPALILFHDGIELSRHIGEADEKKILEILSSGVH